MCIDQSELDPLGIETVREVPEYVKKSFIHRWRPRLFWRRAVTGIKSRIFGVARGMMPWAVLCLE